MPEPLIPFERPPFYSVPRTCQMTDQWLAKRLLEFFNTYDAARRFPDKPISRYPGFLTRADAFVSQTTRERKTHHVVFAPTLRHLDRVYDIQYSRYHSTPLMDLAVFQTPPWGRGAGHGVRFHFEHMSLESPGQIAYAATLEDACHNHWTRTTPARYLERYLPEYGPTQRNAWVDQCKLFTIAEFKVTQTADEAVAVYDHGPQSCMSGRSDEDGHRWNDGEEPTRVYAPPGDLRVAYLGDARKSVSQRAVIWPEKKHYQRIYGSGPLERLLRNAGYRQASLVGARLPEIRTDNDNFLMPYIDGVGQCYRKDGMIVLGYRERVTTYSAQSTLGLLFDEDSDNDTPTCEHCGDECRDGDTYCDYCDEQRSTCARCDCESWTVTFDYTTHTGSITEPVCRECWRSRAICSAPDCNVRYFEDLEFTPDERRARCRDGCTLCPACWHTAQGEHTSGLANTDESEDACEPSPF